MNSIACTIVSGNYLAYAATLRDSLETTDPGLEFRVLIVDTRQQATVDALKRLNLTATWLDELNISNLSSLAFRYNVLELNTNVKPTFLKFLLARGYSSVIYCDPDLYFYSSLMAALEPAGQFSIALTPHIITTSGIAENEMPMLQNGVFNLGFIAVRAGVEAEQFLCWWEERCKCFAFDDVSLGQYVDQKWTNMIPALFVGYHILRNPAMNVAYWNIHEREFSNVDDSPRVNGEPLIFFHFSGVGGAQSSLSKHLKNDKDVTSTIFDMADTYRRRVDANGHQDLKRSLYGFGLFSDGTAILPIHRVLYQHLTSQQLLRTDENPFDVKGEFFLKLRKSALWSKRQADARFDPGTSGGARRTKAVRGIELMLAMAARFLGPAKYWYLCKYLSTSISPLAQVNILKKLGGWRER